MPVRIDKTTPPTREGRFRSFRPATVSGLRSAAAAVMASACLWSQAPANVVVEPSVTLARESVELDAGSLASYAFDLDAGSELSLTVDLLRWQSEPLRVWLVDAPNFRSLVAGRPFDHVERGSGAVERAGRIVAPITSSQRYFVVLDNSQSGSAKTAEVYAYARTPAAKAAEAEIRRLYEGYYVALDTLVEMNGLTLEVKRCGSPNAYAIDARIVVCRELHDMLARGAASGALLFVVLHEVSHGLFSNWGHRWVNAHPNMIDRLAAMLFRMIADGDLHARTAEWLRKTPSGETDQIVFIRGTARARRIASWLEQDEELRRRWARRMVVPNLRTSALETLLAGNGLDDRSREQVRRELSARSRPGD